MVKNIKILYQLKRIAMLSSLLAMISVNAMSQTLERQVLASAGNVSTVSNLEISYTIGEAVITTATTADIILTQGFQQPYFVVIPDDALFPWLVFYPNPTNGDAIARFILDQPNRITITVTNAIGQQVMLESVNYTRGEMQYVLPSSRLLPGVYFISFRLGNGKPMVTKKLIRLDR
jgi:hypothetical protein